MTNFKIECGFVSFNGIEQLLEFGLPIKKGLIYPDNKRLYFTIDDKKLSHTEAKVISTWPCGSIKWMHVRLLCGWGGALKLVSEGSSNEVCEPPLAFVKNKWLGIEHTDNQIFKIQSVSGTNRDGEANGTDSNQRVSLLAENLQFYPTLKLKSEPLLTPFKISKALVQSSKLKHQLQITFTTETPKKAQSFLKVVLDINYCKINQETSIALRIHNTNAAEHLGNTWDLGDKNSIYIDEFSLVFEHIDCPLTLLLREETKDTKENTGTVFNSPFKLMQYGSGGDNWKSPVHWDEHKNSTVQKQGFELMQGQEAKAEGLRSEPFIGFQNQDTSIVFQVADFWQNFPISIDAINGKVRYQLFHPKTELQGGESKTWNFKLSSIKTEDSINAVLQEVADSSVKVSLLPAFVDDTKVFSHLRVSGVGNCLSDIIEQGLTGSQNFFEKRERIDEYGWRNYGELYADHEIAKDFTGDYFVSHYNNQYDPLYGMALQYLISANDRWLELIKPLSQHVQDIDIYDTEYDKGEYNGGLMWHTDHYLPAETCTHRSNSKYHSYAYDGFLGGGGPGGQHCYTTGLLWQYLLCSDERAKDKVLQLTNWVRCFYNGTGSLLDRTFRLLTIDLKNNQLTMVGRTYAGYRYPLDRGIGNFLTAIMDSYEITNDPKLVEEMGFVIRNCVHPSDDLEARDLKNVEDSWFYTVFFQAVVRFLFLKETLGQIDSDYHYARQAFMHYVKWMLDNESFYLDKPEILEFPNDTWCAQDIRKANLLYYGYYFSSDKNEDFIKKGDAFYEYVKGHLSASDEKQYARILAILMQNDGVYQMFNRYSNGKCSNLVSDVKYIEEVKINPPRYQITKILFRYFKDLLRLVLKMSLKKEWNWLKFRLNKLR